MKSALSVAAAAALVVACAAAPAMADERVYRVGAALEAALEDGWGGRMLDSIPELAEQVNR